MAQQLVSGCQVPAQGRATSTVGRSSAASGLARLAGKRIATFGGAKQSAGFTGVSSWFNLGPAGPPTNATSVREFR